MGASPARRCTSSPGHCRFTGAAVVDFHQPEGQVLPPGYGPPRKAVEFFRQPNTPGLCYPASISGGGACGRRIPSPMDAGELLTRWTARVALALYMLALALRIGARGSRPR